MDQSRIKHDQPETKHALDSQRWKIHRTQEEELLTRHTTHTLLFPLRRRRHVYLWRTRSSHKRPEPHLPTLYKVWPQNACREGKESFQNQIRLLSSPRIFRCKINLPTKNRKGRRIILVTNSRQESYESRHIIEEITYHNLPETRLIVVKSCFG